MVSSQDRSQIPQEKPSRYSPLPAKLTPPRSQGPKVPSPVPQPAGTHRALGPLGSRRSPAVVQDLGVASQRGRRPGGLTSLRLWTSIGWSAVAEPASVSAQPRSSSSSPNRSDPAGSRRNRSGHRRQPSADAEKEAEDRRVGRLAPPAPGSPAGAAARGGAAAGTPRLRPGTTKLAGHRPHRRRDPPPARPAPAAWRGSVLDRRAAAARVLGSSRRTRAPAPSLACPRRLSRGC